MSKSDGRIVSLNRFDMMPDEATPQISKEEALQYASDILNELGENVTNTRLTFTRPNFYWLDGNDYDTADFVRMVYEITVGDNDWIIHVDAVTGEIVGGDTSMSDKAGCFGQTDSGLYMGETATKLAQNGFKKIELFCDSFKQR